METYNKIPVSCYAKIQTQKYTFIAVIQKVYRLYPVISYPVSLKMYIIVPLTNLPLPVQSVYPPVS